MRMGSLPPQHARTRQRCHGGAIPTCSFARPHAFQVNDNTVLGAGGEISDFQHIMTLLDELSTDDYRTDDGMTLSPAEVGSCAWATPSERGAGIEQALIWLPDLDHGHASW